MSEDTLISLFTARVREQPAANALLWRDTQWTYADLAGASRSVSDALRACGIQRGDRVAVLLRNSPQYVAAYLGVMSAGAAVLALNAQERASVLVRQIDHSAARVLIGDPTHPEWSVLTNLLADKQVRVMPVDVTDGTGALSAFLGSVGSSTQRDPQGSEVSHSDLALLIYTSGTTGRPKGVMLSHGNLVSNAVAIASYLELAAKDRGFCVLPFHFSYGNSVLTSHLAVGGSVVIEDNLAFPQRSLQRMAHTRATGFAGVPSTFTLLLNRCRFDEFDLGALRYVTQAGGAMTRTAIAQLKQALPKTRVFVMYGQTEATARISYLPPERLEDKLGSVGVAVAETAIDVCDTNGASVPAETVGEIRVRGPGIMLGYWQDPAATKEVIREGWLCTGDLGRKDAEGFLYIEGRAVEMIKVGAFRVSPYEVEEAIGLLPDVQEVAVTGMPDEVLGQAVKATVVLRQGAKLQAMEVKAHCRQHLAAYKIPKVVEFTTSLPRTASGKVQRLQLA